jgi:hypothetical protein
LVAIRGGKDSPIWRESDRDYFSRMFPPAPHRLPGISIIDGNPSNVFGHGKARAIRRKRETPDHVLIAQ